MAAPRPRFFDVPGVHAATIGGKLVAQIVRYGSVRTPFTLDAIQEMLGRAGLSAVIGCAFGETASGHPAIASLDSRERETLCVEAVR